MRWPTYAAHLLIKYYVSKSDPRETFVLVHYAGEVRTNKTCFDYYLILLASNLTEL